MVTMRKHLTPALCLALVLVGLAGCAPSRPASRLTASAVDLATRSGSWPATEQRLQTAINRLDHACMAAHGFQYPDSPRSALPAPEDEAASIDLPGRRDRGYGLAGSTTTRSPAPDPAATYYAHLSAADKRRFDLAFFGPSSAQLTVSLGDGHVVTVRKSGCEAASRRSLIGDVSRWAQVEYGTEDLNNHLADRLAAAPRYRAALSVWRSCMAGHGDDYVTPEAAYQAMQTLYQRSGTTPTVRQREIAVAVADGECAGQAHLPSVALSIKRDLVPSLPTAERQRLIAWTAYRDTAVGRAMVVRQPDR
jgi:hypothetical protein